MRLALVILAATALRGQTLTPSGPASVVPGASVAMTLTLSGAQADLVAIQFSVNVTGGTFVVGSAASSTSKQLYCTQVAAQLNCVIDGGAAALPNGVVATITFTPTSGGTISVTSPLGASQAGDPRSIAAGSPFVFALTTAANKCDLDGNGVVDTVDVGIMRQRVLSTMAPGSSPNITDLQKVKVAQSGGTCTL